MTKMKKNVFLLMLSLLLVANFSYAAELVPNDPDYNKQWYLQDLNMPEVWSLQTGKTDVVIAVIDSGLDLSHPDLQKNIWLNLEEIKDDGLDNDNNGYVDDVYGWDFIDNSNDPTPKYSALCVKRKTCVAEAILHGTFVAGVAAAVGNNSMGITGINWQAKIMPLRVLNSNGSGNTYDVIKAVNYAIDNQADIINLSFVGDVYDRNLEAALNRAYQAGIVVVVAGGNENFFGKTTDLDLQKLYPVCHQSDNGENILLGVGATDQNKKLAEFSNYGSSCIDLVAPGDNFWGLAINDPLVEEFSQYYGGDFAGTSIAAPVVSGVAALIKATDPFLTSQEIIDLILQNTDNIDALNPDYAGKLGHGLINPLKIFKSLRLSSNNIKLLKASNEAIYYKGLNGKRYVFPDTQTYFSWYNKFDNLTELTDQELAKLPLGGMVTIRPGVKLVKITTDPKVYAVDQGGVLRWLETETIAEQLYGQHWSDQVIDVSDAFFVNYQLGEPISQPADYDPFLTRESVVSIDQNLGLFN